MQKIKCLFLIPSLEGGGAERVMSEILANIDRGRIEAVLVMLYDYEDSPYKSSLPDDIRVIVIKRASDSSLGRVKQLVTFLKIVIAEKPHVILSMLTHTNVMAIFSKLITYARVIICEHITLGESIKTEKGRRMLWFPSGVLIKFFYRFADKIIAVSEGIKTNLIEEFNITSRIIEVIYNPIDLNRISDLCGLPSGLSSIEGQVPVICGVGRLVPQKGFDIVLKAFRNVTREIEARLIILGEGPEKESLSGLAYDLGIAEKVFFAGFQQNPYKFISSADIFVLSSRFEGLPMVLLEAMACNTPVVSTDCKSGPREILRDGKYGVLIPPEDIEALSTALLQLLKDAELRERFAELGKQRVKDFAVKGIVSRYEEAIYRSMVSSQ